MRRTRKKKKKNKKHKRHLCVALLCLSSPLLSDYKSSSLEESFVFIDQKAPQTSPTHSKLRREPRLQRSSGDQSEIGCERRLCQEMSRHGAHEPPASAVQKPMASHNWRAASTSYRNSLGKTSRHVTTGKFVSTLFTFDGTSTLWGLSVTSSEKGEGRDESW